MGADDDWSRLRIYALFFILNEIYCSLQLRIDFSIVGAHVRKRGQCMRG